MKLGESSGKELKGRTLNISEARPRPKDRRGGGRRTDSRRFK